MVRSGSGWPWSAPSTQPVRRSNGLAWAPERCAVRHGEVMTSNPLIITQSTKDLLSDIPAGALPTPFLAQMMSALPEGEIVDTMAVELLDRPNLGWFGPVRSNVSARALMSRADPRDLDQHAFRAALVAGATSVGTVRELAALSIEQEAPSEDVWSLVCNPLTATINEPIRTPRDLPQMSGRVAGARLCSVMGAALEGRETAAPRTVLFSPGQYWGVGKLLERHWPWESLTQGQQNAVAAVSKECAGEWEAVARGTGDKRSPLHDAIDMLSNRRSRSSTVEAITQNIDDLLDQQGKSLRDRYLSDLHAAPEEVLAVIEAEADQKPLERMQVSAPATGVSQLNSWIPAVLEADSPAWKMLVRKAYKPTAGRHVGARLFEVTGDDPGLWAAGLDLLESWDRSLPEWLGAVDALK